MKDKSKMEYIPYIFKLAQIRSNYTNSSSFIFDYITQFKQPQGRVSDGS